VFDFRTDYQLFLSRRDSETFTDFWSTGSQRDAWSSHRDWGVTSSDRPPDRRRRRDHLRPRRTVAPDRRLASEARRRHRIAELRVRPSFSARAGRCRHADLRHIPSAQDQPELLRNLGLATHPRVGRALLRSTTSLQKGGHEPRQRPAVKARATSTTPGRRQLRATSRSAEAARPCSQKLKLKPSQVRSILYESPTRDLLTDRREGQSRRRTHTQGAGILSQHDQGPETMSTTDDAGRGEGTIKKRGTGAGGTRDLG